LQGSDARSVILLRNAIYRRALVRHSLSARLYLFIMLFNGLNRNNFTILILGGIACHWKKPI
jgi:hypothetical protein